MYGIRSFGAETDCVLCVTDFPSLLPGIDLGPVHVRFLTDVVALGQVLCEYIAFPLSV